MSRPRQTLVCEGRISSRKLGIAVRRHCNAVEGLVVDRVGEWQRDCGCLIIPVVPRVRRTWHDTAADLRNIVMICRRAALHRVLPEKAALGLHPLAVIAPAPMLAVTLPPLSKCTVKCAVVFPLTDLTLVTLPPTCQSGSDRSCRLTLHQQAG